MRHWLLVIVLIGIGCSCKDRSPAALPSEESASTLGEIQHRFTLNAATQEKFEEGLLLLHNFEYDDALTAFQEATALDSTEVMTHWGEAMSHYKALWRMQDMAAGGEVVGRFGETPEQRLDNIQDPLERDMWQIVEIMYQDGDVGEKNAEIATHLKGLHAKYPAHQEIAAFYALSLIWSTEAYGDGSADLKRAAAIADQILAENPNHPGALHYKIHALDGPTTAAEAHQAADAYAQVAADAAHALHMPSHIYLALGEWDGVVASNRASYDASVERMKSLDLKDGARGYHSYAWLHYGLLQQGRYAEAEEVLRDMLQLVPKDPTKGARGYLVGMQSRQLVAQGSVSPETALDLDIAVEDLGLTAKAVRAFTRAQLAYAQKDITTLTAEVNALRQHQTIAAQQVQGDAIAMCAAGPTRYAPTENDLLIAEVTIAQIRGFIALLNDDTDTFKSVMEHAVATELETNYPTGPPRITQPSFEQYGTWLLAQAEYAEALHQFNASLERMPRRTASLKGKRDALTALDQSDEALTVQHTLDSILSLADQPATL